MPDIVTVLSYFDRKIGPTCFMEMPEELLSGDLRLMLNQIFDQTTSEGFFWHSIAGKWETSLNYYFEISSEWARGYKEMLMISIIFPKKLTTEKENQVLSWVVDFKTKLSGWRNAFKAFYYNIKMGHEHQEAIEINEKYNLVQKWLKELYWSVREEVRERTEEESIATLMSSEPLYQVVKKLSKYPVAYDELREWFISKNFNRDLDKIISTLEKESFIFMNTISHEKFVLLVKDVKISRVPPSCVMELLEKRDSLQPLVDYYVQSVGTFFDNYQPDTDDKQALYQLLSQSKHYNLITELRKGPIPKSKVGSILRQGPAVATRIDIITELKELDVIDEFSFLENTYLLLKTDVTVETRFPEYIQRAIPDKEKINKHTKEQLAHLAQDLQDVFGPMGEGMPLEFEFAGDVEEALAISSSNEHIETDQDTMPQLEESMLDLMLDEISERFLEEEKKDEQTTSSGAGFPAAGEYQG